MDYLEEQRQFWDEFADEYYEIQQESFTTIVEDVAQYLLETNCLPCQLFVDIAGGYGKYLPAIAPYVNQYLLVNFSANMLKQATHTNDNVQYIQCDQQTFCANSNPDQYDLVFSAMNPALNTLQQLNDLLRMTKNQLILLQVVDDQDTVFTPLEQFVSNNVAPAIPFEKFKKWLEKEGIPWVNKTFSYQREEPVTKIFVQDYFKEELQKNPALKEKIATLFVDSGTITAIHKITFELLRILK